MSATRHAAASARRRSSAELVDIAFLAVLCAVALSGLRSSYAGWTFLLVGIAGILLGVAAGHLAFRVTRSVLVAVAASAAAYFLVGPFLIARGQGVAAAVPGPSTLSSAANAAVQGWKQLLTTAPPVGDSEPLLAVPFLLGMAAAVAGYALARRAKGTASVALAPLVVLAAVVALGTDQPTQWTLTGAIFTAATLLWIAVRARRRVAAAAGAHGYSRLLTGLAVLGVASVCAAAVEPWLPGAGGAGRQVARDHITPPLDLSAYPSPLVGFHKYTKDANQLWNQTLMTVAGLPQGVPIQIAALDDYNGSVWGAVNAGRGDEFERVGASLAGAPGAPAPAGPATTVRITVEPAYADAADIDPWLPTAGAVTGISIAARSAAAATADLADSLWYNQATSTGIVTSRLHAGDTIVLRTVLGATALPADAQPYGPPTITAGYQSLFSARAAVWDKGAASLSAQLKAIGTYLRNQGAYSDGGPGEGRYLPGHSIVRLTGFLNGPQPVGDDEQYAAAYALIAESLGIPARVVFGALAEPGGVVRGRDIHAWVQVHVASGAWATIPDADFMPSETKTPAPQPPQTAQQASATVVPPPNALHPPTGATAGGGSANSAPGHSGSGASGLPAWLGTLLTVLGWAGLPLALIAFAFGVVAGLKTHRRHRRRTTGSPANRFAAGWLDLVDHARDLGFAVPGGITRQQQAGRLAGTGLAALARTADSAVFGPGDPGTDHALAYWRQIDAARRELTRRAGRRTRLRAAFDLRTLIPAVPGTRGAR
ncbi:MAG TPA: transglutaminase-like domain-containing protein [Actinocrinis sp.]|nr:transglutaminase-like domain-containing protein [Actinocrinis sp.]